MSLFAMVCVCVCGGDSVHMLGTSTRFTCTQTHTPLGFLGDGLHMTRSPLLKALLILVKTRRAFLGLRSVASGQLSVMWVGTPSRYAPRGNIPPAPLNYATMKTPNSAVGERSLHCLCFCRPGSLGPPTLTPSTF